MFLFRIRLIFRVLFCLSFFIPLCLLPNPSFGKYASIIIEAESGKIHHSVNADTRNYPASLTKLMTLYLLFDALNRKKINMNTKLKVSRKAAIQPASKIGLSIGSSITVKNAINALIIKSANDVATVVAENLGKSEKRFALIMTHKARKIGMKKTIFRNASGLSHRAQMSTARDMATLANRIIKDFPQYYHLFSKTRFSYNGRVYRTHNKVLKTFKGAEGMKTGYIRASGYNLITTARKDGKRLIGVIFGGDSARSRDRHMRTLLNRAYTRITKSRERPVSRLASLNWKKVTNLQIKSKTSANHSPFWGIQVGAFYSVKPANKLIAKILTRYKTLLRAADIRIMPIRKPGYQILYRARIENINMGSAYRVCRLLKQVSQPCIPFRMKITSRVAQG
mgnify:CR=1 FL=1